jgi:AraC-like DNA-binding protein
MQEIRYEEHIRNPEGLPFTFVPDLVLTPANYNRKPNWHDNLELQLCTYGKGTVMLDEKFLPFEQDDIVVVNSTVLHYTDSPKELRCDCLIIDTRFCQSVNLDPISLRFTHKIRSERLNELVQELSCIYKDKSAVCREAKLIRIVMDILIELREKHIEIECVQPIKNADLEVVKNTIKYIKVNYDKKLSLEDIAKNVFVNQHALSRKFKNVTNQTIVAYINSYRCKKALDHILNGASVAEAAGMSGFTNMSFFSKTFKQVMGYLPSEYKK